MKKKKAREVREREQSSRLIRKSRRSRQEDSSKSKAMDELKAKRSAGIHVYNVHVHLVHVQHVEAWFQSKLHAVMQQKIKVMKLLFFS